MQLTTETVRTAVAAALIEDQAADDVTTRWSVPEALEAEATMIAKQSGRVAGLAAVQEVYAAVDPTVTVRTAVADGDPVVPGQPLAWISGAARSVITGERVALNFAQRMSGIANLTSAFVAAIDGRPIALLDTRKTAPGLRAMDKYAVSCGGGTKSSTRLEASGNITLDTVADVAATGVDAISVGALTHSPTALDISLLVTRNHGHHHA